jgi:hypothetical protein
MRVSGVLLGWAALAPFPALEPHAAASKSRPEPMAAVVSWVLLVLISVFPVSSRGRSD